MTEILTESFCERCGTRYTFESARPKIRLKGVKVLSRGLKNFVLSDDTTMDEAMAAARSETDREVTSHQLDAFHKTFSFCMSCRQYTCPNCWNEVEARCQSCAPLSQPEIAPREIEPIAFPGLMTLAKTTAIAEPASNGANGHHQDEIMADETVAVEAGPSVVELEARSEATSAELEVVSAELEAVSTPPEIIAAEPKAAEPEAAAPEAEAIATQTTPEEVVVEPALKATNQTTGLLHRFRPGQSLDDELAAFERERSRVEAEDRAAQAAEPVQAPSETAAIVGEPVEAVEAAPIEAGADEVVVEVAVAEAPVEIGAGVDLETGGVAQAEAEPAAPPAGDVVEPETGSVAQAEAEPAAPPAGDVVEQPTWRITAPDAEVPAVDVPAHPDSTTPLQASGVLLPPTEPQWPPKLEWPAPQASAGLPFLGRPAQPHGGAESLWAASNRELVATPPAPGRSASGIQPCISCGLSLSANARFCRRCGTRQDG